MREYFINYLNPNFKFLQSSSLFSYSNLYLFLKLRKRLVNRAP